MANFYLGRIGKRSKAKYYELTKGGRLEVEDEVHNRIESRQPLGDCCKPTKRRSTVFERIIMRLANFPEEKGGESTAAVMRRDGIWHRQYGGHKETRHLKRFAYLTVWSDF